MPTQPTEQERRAAALEALRKVPPSGPSPSPVSRLIAAAALLLGLWLVVRTVGRFVGSSQQETSRATEELRRGMAR